MPTTIVSNLKRDLQEYLVKNRALKYWLAHSKDFMIKDEVDQASFNYAIKNISLYLRF